MIGSRVIRLTFVLIGALLSIVSIEAQSQKSFGLCPDLRLREATITGETISGSVRLRKRPLALAPVRVFFSSGKVAWTGTTDKNGRFMISQLPPDDYRLEIHGWGSATVHLKPVDKTKQIPVWNLMLADNGCIGTGEIMN